MGNINLMSQKLWVNIFEEAYKRRAVMLQLVIEEYKVTIDMMNMLHFISTEYFYAIDTIMVENGNMEITYKIEGLNRFGY